jgi:hypothetical protein
MQSTITAMAAGFTVQLGGLVFIHSFLLKPDYLTTASLWRAQEAQMERVWAMLLAILIYVIGAAGGGEQLIERVGDFADTVDASREMDSQRECSFPGIWVSLTSLSK